MNKPERNSKIAVAILLIIATVVAFIAVDWFWKQMWQVHLDNQIIIKEIK